MSPSEVATAIRWRLASDIETELASQGRVAERIAALRLRLVSEPDDWIVAAAMAFEIERWYTAVESLFSGTRPRMARFATDRPRC